jgi:hypothetical protein
MPRLDAAVVLVQSALDSEGQELVHNDLFVKLLSNVLLDLFGESFSRQA